MEEHERTRRCDCLQEGTAEPDGEELEGEDEEEAGQLIGDDVGGGVAGEGEGDDEDECADEEIQVEDKEEEETEDAAAVALAEDKKDSFNHSEEEEDEEDDGNEGNRSISVAIHDRCPVIDKGLN